MSNDSAKGDAVTAVTGRKPRLRVIAVALALLTGTVVVDRGVLAASPMSWRSMRAPHWTGYERAVS